MLLVSNVHIPLRIDLGLGQEFETTVWCWSHIYFCDRLLCFSPLPCPSREGHAAGDPRSWANPKIRAAGVGCGGGNTERRSFGSSLLTLDQHQRGPLSLSNVVPGWKAAGCYNRPQHRLSSVQETGLFFVIRLALLPLEQQPRFFKTWSEARPLAFPPGKSSGLMGCTWRVPLQPAAGTAAACGGFTLWLPVRATPRPGGAELQPGGLEASAHWPHLPLFFP